MDLPAAVQAVFKELSQGRAYPETFHEAIPSLSWMLSGQGACAPSKPKTLHQHK